MKERLPWLEMLGFGATAGHEAGLFFLPNKSLPGGRIHNTIDSSLYKYYMIIIFWEIACSLEHFLGIFTDFLTNFWNWFTHFEKLIKSSSDECLFLQIVVSKLREKTAMDHDRKHWKAAKVCRYFQLRIQIKIFSNSIQPLAANWQKLERKFENSCN